jgi:hypothetical protein
MRKTERRTRRYFALRFFSMASQTARRTLYRVEALLQGQDSGDHRADGYQSS